MSTLNKFKLKKGDEVLVIAGKDKGKTGKITVVKTQVNKAIVAGINKVKKHQKPDNNQAGGIIEKEMPINVSNLAYYDSISKKGVKLGYKFNEKASFVSEVEMEHVIELYVEQAFLNYKIKDNLSLNAGLMLIPMGIQNLYHEPPTFNGVERTNVDKYIVPTT